MDQRNIRLGLSFNGSCYRGWQKQKNAPSVQHSLEKALSKTFKDDIKTVGIGRTDAGAHAFHYIANFQTRDRSIPCKKLPRILNCELPDDIRVLSASEESGSFHSRYSAIAREYVYIAVNGPAGKSPLPIAANLACFPDTPADVSRLKKACRLFRGKHDFRNFCYGYGSDMDFRREIFYLRVKEVMLLETPVLVFFIKGSGFLKGMIRSILSACFHFANGDISGDMIRQALKCEKALQTKFRAPVPASGLYFKRGYFNSRKVS